VIAVSVDLNCLDSFI